MSRNILDLPYTILSPIIITLIVYWMVGLSSTPTQFFTYLLVMISTAFTGASFGLLVGSIVTDAKSVSIAVPLIFEPSMLFAGFFKNLINLPSWIGWIQYLSPIKYGFAAMVQNEVQFGSAPFLQNLNLNTSLWLSIGLSFTLGVAFRVLCLFFLWRLKSKVQ
jgi:ABC-type multidrug transport system permease subunit